MHQEVVALTALEEKIRERYAGESTSNACLSCAANLSYIDLKPGEYVLDLGCGTGMETIEAATAVGESGMAVGLDLTPEMIKAAEHNAVDHQVGNVRFVVGSIEQLPFDDQSFDVVTSNCVINHARDKTKVYREIFRVLKKGGRFIISDPVSKEPLPEEIRNDPAQWAACFGGVVTEGEYLENIRRAGFERIIILKRREYLKNGYEFASLTLRAEKG